MLDACSGFTETAFQAPLLQGDRGLFEFQRSPMARVQQSMQVASLAQRFCSEEQTEIAHVHAIITNGTLVGCTEDFAFLSLWPSPWSRGGCYSVL